MQARDREQVHEAGAPQTSLPILGQRRGSPEQQALEQGRAGAAVVGQAQRRHQSMARAPRQRRRSRRFGRRDEARALDAQLPAPGPGRVLAVVERERRAQVADQPVGGRGRGSRVRRHRGAHREIRRLASVPAESVVGSVPAPTSRRLALPRRRPERTAPRPAARGPSPGWPGSARPTPPRPAAGRARRRRAPTPGPRSQQQAQHREQARAAPRRGQSRAAARRRRRRETRSPAAPAGGVRQPTTGRTRMRRRPWRSPRE